MLDLDHPTALDYLPPGIAAKPLYKFLGPMIDRALTPSDGANEAQVDPLVEQLMLDFEDAEAVNAYLNTFVKPVIGTRSGMELAFKLLGIHPALTEWYQARLPSPYDTLPPVGPSDKPFHFTVTFPDGTLPTGAFDYHELIRLLLVLKNERSRLMSLRMADCVDMLTLDNDCELDMYWLDSLEGFVDPETQVVICLHDNFVQAVDRSTQVPGYLTTWHRVETAYAFSDGLDFTSLSTDTLLDRGLFLISVGRISDTVQRMTDIPACIDPVTGLFLNWQGRTSWLASNVGGADIATHVHPMHTTRATQALSVPIDPQVEQTVSGRLVSQRIPATGLYAQPTWEELPDLVLVGPDGSAVTLDGEVLDFNGGLEDGFGSILVSTGDSTEAGGAVTDAIGDLEDGFGSILTSSGEVPEGALGDVFGDIEDGFGSILFTSATDVQQLTFPSGGLADLAGSLIDVNGELVDGFGSAFVTSTYGATMTWRDDPTQSWVSDQPQVYSTRTSQIIGGWVLGGADLVLPRPALTGGVLFSGVRGPAEAVVDRPSITEIAAFAAPAGPLAGTAPRPVAISGAKLGESAVGRGRVSRPGAHVTGYMVPVGTALASARLPTAASAGAASDPA